MRWILTNNGLSVLVFFSLKKWSRLVSRAWILSDGISSMLWELPVHVSLCAMCMCKNCQFVWSFCHIHFTHSLFFITEFVMSHEISTGVTLKCFPKMDFRLWLLRVPQSFCTEEILIPHMDWFYNTFFQLNLYFFPLKLFWIIPFFVPR